MPALSLNALQKKTINTSRQLTYTYYVFTPGKASSKPALLLCHGFPDDAQMFAPIMPELTALGHPIIIPDMLGYSGSSKPTDASLMNSKSVSADLLEIVKTESVAKVIPVGHDWGSFIAARFYNWNPDFCAGLVLLNVAYIPPNISEPFDLKKHNEMIQQLLGYPNFAYWEFFTANDAAGIIEDHLESFWTVLHADRPMKDIWCDFGGMRKYLLEDKQSPLREYAKDAEFKEQFMARMKRDGIQSPLNWYVSSTDNHHHAVEKDLPTENMIIKVPHLFLGCMQDEVCRHEFVQGPKDGGLLPDLTVKTIDEPHWVLFSNPDAVADALVSWLKEKYI